MSVQIAGDARLFVLEDEGVLFAESRQELYLLNSAATLLWCLLEDGVPFDRLLSVYADAFGCTPRDAERHVYPTLKRWFAMGHISDPPVSILHDTPLTGSLAFLLTNRELRARFRESPRRTADALAVCDDDIDAFLALDPDALDEVAEQIDETRRRRRFQAPQAFSLAADRLAAARDSTWQAPTVTRWYRLIDTTFHMTLPVELETLVCPVLKHLETEAGDASAVGLHIRRWRDGFVIGDGLAPGPFGTDISTLVPALKGLLRQIAVRRHRYFMEIHAGVVLLDHRAVLLPGSAGQGKTTLTAALVRDGAEYFSDEIALLEAATLHVRPLPLAMTIKQGSLEALRPFYAQLDTLPEHRREDRQRVRYLPPPPRERRSDGQLSHPVAWVVFPRFVPEASSTLTPLKRTIGLRRLLDEALVLPELLDARKVERLVRWVRQLQFYELQLSSLEAAVEAIRSLPAMR